MAIERDSQIRFHELGTLQSVTRWIRSHDEGLAEWLKKGNNEIVVFELIKPEVNTISALNKPVLSDLDEAYNKAVLSE